jgi:hypothetical protein
MKPYWLKMTAASMVVWLFWEENSLGRGMPISLSCVVRARVSQHSNATDMSVARTHARTREQEVTRRTRV